MKKIYQDYADLKLQAKELDLKIKAINAQIIEDMLAKKTKEPVKTDFGTFTLKQLPTWTYSDKVEDLKVKLAKQKEKEEEIGLATKTVKPSLTFNAPRNK